jgi:excisionase family DNA binding protein
MTRSAGAPGTTGDRPSLDALLGDPAQLAALPAGTLPGLLGELERLRAALWVRLTTPTPTPPEEADRLLTIPEVAGRLGVPTPYAYELARRGALPTVRVGPKYVRVSAAALADWTTRQQKGLDNGSMPLVTSRHGTRRVSATTAPARPDAGATRRAARRDNGGSVAVGARRVAGKPPTHS